MANPEHLAILNRGVDVWNQWRFHEGAGILPDLSGADLSSLNLPGANFYRVDLSEIQLSINNLAAVNFWGANLAGVDFNSSVFLESNLQDALLCGASFRGTMLFQTNLSNADLRNADFTEAKMAQCTFSDNDLSTAIGLDTVEHLGPSSIGVDTLYKSNGKVPEAFLRGTGVPEDFIRFVPSLVGRAIEFYSCFISYSHKNVAFVRRLYSAMRAENLRVWFAPEDLKAGRKLHEEIFRAIQIHDKVLLVLSEHSMNSEWVTTEIRRARKVEREENRQKLFPIRLVDFATIQAWECFDPDSGKDLAVELREYYIPDFSNWQDQDVFAAEFRKLLEALKASAA